MSGNLQPSSLDIIKLLAEKLKSQVLIFALTTIGAIYLWGAGIAQSFIPLIYIVVVGGLVLYSVPIITAAIRKNKAQIQSNRPLDTNTTRSTSAQEKINESLTLDSSPVAPIDSSRNPVDIEKSTATASPISVAPRTALLPLSAPDQLRAYLDFVQAASNLLRLGGLSSESSDPQKRLAETRNPGTLAEVFVSLEVDRYRDEFKTQETLKHLPLNEESISNTEREKLTAIEALSDRKTRLAVLLGQPGAGKSSILRYLSHRLAEAYLRPELLDETIPTWVAGPMLPVFVPLAKLADTLHVQVGSTLSDRVALFISEEIEFGVGLSALSELILNEAKERGVLFLFDGLDEVVPHQRETIKDALNEFLSIYGRCRAIVTCRTFSYGDERWWLEGWPVFQLETLTGQQQDEFIQKWYEALTRNDSPSRAIYEKKASLLKEGIFSGDTRQLGHLARIPLLLTLITIVHTHRDELPRSRVLIYKECVELLLIRWQKRRQPGAPLRTIIEAIAAAVPDLKGVLESRLMRALYEVAFLARDGRGLQQGETTLIDLYTLKSVLEPKLGEDATKIFLEYCQYANGLLLGIGSRHMPERAPDEAMVPCFAFPHPSFEEYLAAQHISGLAQPQIALANRNASSDQWFYVGLFLGEYYGIINMRAYDVLGLIEELVSRRQSWSDGEGYWRNVWLAGLIWQIFATEFPDKCALQTMLKEQVREELKELCVTGGLSPLERTNAGQVLAKIGDPRFRENSWFLPDDDLLGFIEIPEGEFIMGSDKKRDPDAFDDEQPLKKIKLPRYFIAKYPVTVAQFRAFVEATNRQSDFTLFLDGHLNEPVVWVRWIDALSYCEWLTEILINSVQTQEPLATLLKIQGWRITLPDEVEWEKAARGIEPRIFPWGDKFNPQSTNSIETGIGAVSTVGCFPDGKSIYGVYDLSGNIWEWTRSGISKDISHSGVTQKVRTADNRIVVRGGSFDSNSRYCRCACRSFYNPDSRGNSRGFRLALTCDR